MNRLALTLALLGIAGALPAAAQATLVYDKNVGTTRPPSVYGAQNDASAAHRLGAGQRPDLSPDGTMVAWAGPDFARPKLIVSPTATGAPRTLLTHWRGYGVLAWSPDSRTIATLVGPEIKAKSLVLVDVATGTARTLAKGFFGGVSFSPAGDQLIYARGAKENLRFDLYRYDLAPQTITTLTSDHRAGTPVWGPKTIVFSRLVDEHVRRYGPKSELFTISTTGQDLKRLTSQRVGSLLFGLSPTQFSAAGSRLLGQFTGQDTSYAQVVDPATGKVRTLGKAQEAGYQGLALSHDGKAVLAATGGSDPSGRHDIVVVPYGGGPAKTLVKHAFAADWDR